MSTAAVTHAIPGRLRLRVGDASVKRRREILSAVEDMREHDGVRSVSTNERTGSALITFDPEHLDPEGVVRILRTAHEALDDLVPPAIAEHLDRSASEVAEAVQARASRANQRVLKATDGRVDLRMLVPIGLAGVGLRQLLREGPALASIPWYVLCYYAFDTFVKLHGAPGQSASSR